MKKPKYGKAYLAFILIGLLLTFVKLFLAVPYYVLMGKILDISGLDDMFIPELIEKGITIFIMYFVFKWSIDKFAIREHLKETKEKVALASEKE